MVDNNVSKKIKSLIAVVLVFFFGALVSDLFPEGINDFKRGFNDGYESVHTSDSLRLQNFYVDVVPRDPDATTRKFADGTEFTTISAVGELYVPAPRGSGWGAVETVLLMLSLIAGAAAITFIVQIIKFAVRFRRRPILSRDNVVSLRWIAATLGVMGLTQFANNVIVTLWVRAHVTIEGYGVGYLSFPMTLIVAAILLIMTEILNLAGKLQNEHDLTI